MAAFSSSFLSLVIFLSSFSNILGEGKIPLEDAFKSGHTNNWAVLVSRRKVQFFYIFSIFFIGDSSS